MEILKNQGREFGLRLSVFQIYQDIVTDLTVFGSRGLTVYEKDEQSYIENLSEHCISNFSELKSHMHHAFQVRKTIMKPDPKLKLKSSFIVFFSLYENSVLYSQIGLIELPGSENASNDQGVIKANSLSVDEKKAIARSFNALTAVLSSQNLYRESSLTLSCKSLLKGNVSVICTLNQTPGNFKHTLATLKYSQRLREGPSRKQQHLQQGIKEELFTIRNELKEAKLITTDWADSRGQALNRLQSLIQSSKSLLGSPQECEEFLIEINILQQQLKALRAKPPTPLIKTESLRRRSASPFNEEISTDREGLLRNKLSNLQSQYELQLRKIEEISNQVTFRDSDIRVLHGRISELEKALGDKDRVVQEIELKNNEYANKINEYARKLKVLSSKNLSQAQLRNARDEVLEDQIVDLDGKLSKEREDHALAVQKLKMSLQTKDRIVQELQTSSNSCLNEKDAVIQELKQKLKSKTLAISDLEKQVLSLSNTYNEARYKLEVTQSNNKKLEEESNLLRKRIEDVNHRNSSIESKNLLLLQKSESLDKDLNSALQEIDSRKFKTQQLSSTLKEMESTICVSAEEVARMRFELNQLRSENQIFRVDKENLSIENQDIRLENHSIKQELKRLEGHYEETSQFMKEKESKLSSNTFVDNPIVKQKKKKIRVMKESVQELQQQLRDCQSLAESEIKKVLDERDQALAELDEWKNGQNHELSMVESQVNIIEEQLVKLKEQNRMLQGRESELLKELRNSEVGKEKYKETIIELKEQIKNLQGQLADMDEFAKEYIEGHRKEIKDMKIGEDKAVVLKSRIRAMHDVKNMIFAHRSKNNN